MSFQILKKKLASGKPEKREKRAQPKKPVSAAILGRFSADLYNRLAPKIGHEKATKKVEEFFKKNSG